MVRPILEYVSVIWGPHYVLDQRKLEGVQRRATKLVPSLRDKSYIDRLTSMNLPSLLYRHRCGDLIFLFKMLNDYFNLDHSYFFTFSHNHKLEVMHINYLSPLPTIHVGSTILVLE